MPGLTRKLQLVLLLSATAIGSSALVSSADAALLTVVARECPSYQAITANIARNNIMESLEQLVPDSPYQAGDQVNPKIEEKEHQGRNPIEGRELAMAEG